MQNPRTMAASTCALIGLIALSACQTGGEGAATSNGSEPPTPHGYVEGAEEADEPQLRLAVSDADTGRVSMLDLLTEEVIQEVPATPETQLLAADSRYVYLGDAKAGAVTVVDTGAWTVDHGDHKHYYRADPQVVGEVSGTDPAHVVSEGTAVAFFFDGDGAAKIYDRTAFDNGELKETGTASPGPHHGVAVPYEDHVVSTVPGDRPDDLPSALAVYDEAGKSSAMDVSCEQIHGAAASREGLVFACADGVISVNEDFDAELLSYPGEAGDERAWSMKAGRDLIAVPFDGGGVGILSPESGEWQFADTTAPVISVGVAPDDSTTVALDEDGTVYAIDPKTGEVLAEEKVIEPVGPEADSHSGGPSVAVDRERTYVSDPVGGRVVELDTADGLREARNFDLGGQPAGLAVTGR
ncbi:PQQ-binding-like beta-propeller repeat protein [Saxibacter everestensis]|uniref:PQQ-binding-like beta-propeller repeat protein n=1 Tax=Saxibacter everestensis TaxID=2909229 RepID=A0ABY8QS54_9MICO|nr:PQQ-binding-like beta-propeller repeat protein [Brevibacteriaceae bacterium ZFBP1038]